MASDRRPLVFYCRQCKGIVGDSFTILSTDEELGIILFERVTNARIVRDTVRCQCDASLGYVHNTKYALETKAIRSYELGGTDLHARVDQVESDLRDDIRKIQGVLLALHERVLALERPNT